MNLNNILWIIAPAGMSFGLALIFTHFMQRIAPRMGLVDRPDGHRKLQGNVTALGGGVAILLAFLLTIALIYLCRLPGADALRGQPVFTMGLCGAGILICLVGLIDDRFDLRGRQKLVAQMISVFFVVCAGLMIETVEVFGWQIQLGVFAIPFTMLWLLGAINALNLIDGVDGLAGTVSVILSLTIAALAAMGRHHGDALIALILAGASLGFLIFNYPPARIYLGDAGSMLIGLILGALAIRCSLKGPATVALVAPTAIWSILAFDIAMAVFRRKLTGRSIYSTDRAHIHHVLQRHGFSISGVVLFIGTLCTVCAMGALVSVALKNEMAAIGTTASVLAILVLTGFFGRSECSLFARRIKGFLTSLVRIPNREAPRPVHFCSRFHGNREWEILWESLLDYAHRFELSQVQLNVSSPAIGEEYHAVWQQKSTPSPLRTWKTEVPLFVQELCVGRLTIVGSVGQGAVVSWMAELIEGLRPFEFQMITLLEELLPPPSFPMAIEQIEQEVLQEAV